MSGPDIFLSYSRVDGATYAAGLGRHLSHPSRDLHCFLDQWDAPPRRHVPPHILRALRRSTMLVLVGTQAAARSKSVHRELLTFRRRNWRIIPISFDGGVECAVWFPLVEGIARETEHSDALLTGVPSQGVLNRIESSYKYSKRNSRVRRTLMAATAGVTLFLMTSIFSYRQSSRREQATIAEQLVLNSNRILAEDHPAIETAVLLAGTAMQSLNVLGIERSAAVRSLTEGLRLLPRMERRFTLSGIQFLRILPDHRHLLAVTTNAAFLVDLEVTDAKPDEIVHGFKDFAANGDGTALLLANDGEASFVRLPSKKVIRWDGAPAFDVAGLSKDGSVVAVGSGTRVFVWRPENPEVRVVQTDLKDFEPTDIAVVGFPFTRVIAASDTVSENTPFSSMVEHKLWVILPDIGFKQSFDVSTPISQFAAGESGRTLVTAGRRRRAYRGIGQFGPYEVTVWALDYQPAVEWLGKKPKPETLTVGSVREEDSKDLKSVADNNDVVAILGDGRLRTLGGSDNNISADDSSSTEVVLTGSSALALNEDGSARLYELKSGREIARVPHGVPVTAGAVDEASERLVTASKDGLIKVWRLSHPLQGECAQPGLDSVSAFSKDRRIAVGEYQRSTKAWRVEGWKPIPLKDPPDKVVSYFTDSPAVLNPRGSLLAESVAGPAGSNVLIYSTGTGAIIKRFDLGAAAPVAFSENYVLCMANGRLAVIDWNKGRISWPYGDATPVESATKSAALGEIVVSKDGAAAASLTGETAIDVYAVNVNRHQIIKVAAGDRPLSLSGDAVLITGPGQVLVGAEPPKTSRTARIWNLRTGRLAAAFPVEWSEEMAGVSPNSKYLLTMIEYENLRQTFRVLELTTGRELFRTLTATVFPSFDFSPDSKYLAISADGEIRVFDLQNGGQLAAIPTSQLWFGIAFDAESQHVLAWGYGSTRRWNWRPQDLVREVCESATRNLTQNECEKYLPGHGCPSLCPAKR